MWRQSQCPSGLSRSPRHAFLVLELPALLGVPLALELLGLPLVHPGGVLAVLVQVGLLAALPVQVHLPI